MVSCVPPSEETVLTSEYRIEVSLPAEFGHQDITDQVAAWVQASRVRTGVVTVQAVGSTSGITTIEYESGAVADLRRALEAFHKAPAKSWTVETLAQAAGMSRTSFAVLFQKKMVMTPMQYVTSWRIEIAKKLLSNPATTLTDAAEGAGYASDSAFSRVFKKETGLTPAGFKRFDRSDRPQV